MGENKSLPPPKKKIKQKKPKKKPHPKTQDLYIQKN